MLKDELEAIIASDNAWSGRATLLLAIGILGEYVAAPFFEHANLALMMAVFRSRRATALRNVIKRCGAVFKTLFAAMVLVGVVGEYGFSSRIAINANRLQQIADQELFGATDRATRAIEQAGIIGDRADRLTRVLEAERQTTARFQKQATASEARLTEATAALDDAQKRVALSIRRRAPRNILLHDAFIGNDRRLPSFRGQSVVLLNCINNTGSNPLPAAMFVEVLTDTDNPISAERNRTWQELGYQLLQVAHWNPRIVPEEGCTDLGIRIRIDPLAKTRTSSAARVLASVLHDALLLEEDDNPPISTLSLPAELYELIGVDEAAFRTDSFFVVVSNNPPW
jgi:hypothetical protein